MASSDCENDNNFHRAVACALSCVKRDRFVLIDKPKQAEAIKFIYDGEDVFLWLPTGYGKSVCYQVLPFLFDYTLGMYEHRLDQPHRLILRNGELLHHGHLALTKTLYELVAL